MISAVLNGWAGLFFVISVRKMQMGIPDSIRQWKASKRF